MSYQYELETLSFVLDLLHTCIFLETCLSFLEQTYAYSGA